MTIPTPLSTQPTVSTNPAGISRRAAMGRLGALGGAFLAWNFLGDAFAQTSTPDAIVEMRKAMAATPPSGASWPRGYR